MKYILSTFIIVCQVLAMQAQQEIILTKYTFNSLFFNPAYAGSTGEDQGSATLQYRSQWVGVEGAPTTLLAAAEYSFFDNALGLGLSVGQESIGANSNTDIGLSTSYRMRIGEGYLSGGLRTGFGLLSTDFTRLDVLNGGDIFDSGRENLTLFNVGAGILYHDEVFEIGFSVPTIVSIGEGSIDRTQHIYGHMSVLIGDEYSSIKWQPEILVKYEKSVPLQLTIGVQAWLTERLAPGLHWRLGESLAASLEFKFLEDWSITAAYDFTTNDLHDYTAGSMELMLGYRFGDEGGN